MHECGCVPVCVRVCVHVTAVPQYRRPSPAPPRGTAACGSHGGGRTEAHGPKSSPPGFWARSPDCPLSLQRGPATAQRHTVRPARGRAGWAPWVKRWSADSGTWQRSLLHKHWPRHACLALSAGRQGVAAQPVIPDHVPETPSPAWDSGQGPCAGRVSPSLGEPLAFHPRGKTKQKESWPHACSPPPPAPASGAPRSPWATAPATGTCLVLSQQLGWSPGERTLTWALGEGGPRLQNGCRTSPWP